MDETVLQQRLSQLDKQAQLALDKAQIQNIANRYQYLHGMILDQYIPSLYAQKVQVTRHDVGRGIYTSLESIKKYHSPYRPRYRSKIVIHCQGNPIIEVAGDGQTAKGLWFSSGFEGNAFVNKPDPTFEPTLPMYRWDEKGFYKWTDWVWHKIGIDFIKEDGEWKIWHYLYCEIFRSPFNEDTIDFVLKTDPLNSMRMGLFSKLTPEKPTPLSAPHDLPSPVSVCGYDITQPPSLYVREPEPYNTFSETFSY